MGAPLFVRHPPGRRADPGADATSTCAVADPSTGSSPCWPASTGAPLRPARPPLRFGSSPEYCSLRRGAPAPRPRAGAAGRPVRHRRRAARPAPPRRARRGRDHHRPRPARPRRPAARRDPLRPGGGARRTGPRSTGDARRPRRRPGRRRRGSPTAPSCPAPAASGRPRSAAPSPATSAWWPPTSGSVAGAVARGIGHQPAARPTPAPRAWPPGPWSRCSRSPTSCRPSRGSPSTREADLVRPAGRPVRRAPAASPVPGEPASAAHAVDRPAVLQVDASPWPRAPGPPAGPPGR